MSVTVGWIDGGTVRGEFTESVTQLASYETHHQRLVSVVRVRSGPLLEEGRNRLVERFLDTGAEWLLMVDTDMTFRYDAAEHLVATAADRGVEMVGGLSFGVNDEFGQFPTLYRNLAGQPVVWFDYPAGKVVEVDATGSAFTVTHRNLYLDYRRADPQPWFHRLEIPPTGERPGGVLGEDLSWCWHLRSKGVPIMVNTAVEAGHVKSVTIDEAMYRRARDAAD